MKLQQSVFCCLLATVLGADDIMVQRMQSVVDEVTELRTRYEASVKKNEACMDQVNKQNDVIKKISRNEGFDYKTFEQNRLELEQLKAQKSSSKPKDADKEMQRELEVLQKDNQRLNASAQILVEKNHSLLEQLNKIKRSKNDAKDSELAGVKEELKRAKEELKTSREKNARLSAELVSFEQENKKAVAKLATASVSAQMYAALQEENKRLEEDVKTSKRRKNEPKKSPEYLALLEEKEQLQKDLTAAKSKKCKPETIVKVKTKKVCVDDNPFPKLMMKKDKRMKPHDVDTKPVIEVKKAPAKAEKTAKTEAPLIVREKGSAYRVKEESAIYDAPDGKVIAVWEAKTSFTSNTSKGKWIKITGHFVNQKWRRSTEEMWVREKDTLKR